MGLIQVLAKKLILNRPRGLKFRPYGTVAEVKSALRFPVIYSVFFEEDQSEVRMHSRYVLKIHDVADEF